jgi:DNA-binding PadR family transcriptional regulator
MDTLTILEQIILASILSLKDNAYGLEIRKKAKILSDKSIMYGTLYNALDQLTRKGYVEKKKRKADSQKGGHDRVYYSITKAGVQSLQEAYKLQQSVWAGIPEIKENI